MGTAIRNLKNISGADLLLSDFNGMTIDIDETVNGLTFGEARLRASLDIIRAIADGQLEVNDGTHTYTGQSAIDLIKGSVDQFTKDGKKIFTMSDRPQDHYRYFTTHGDNLETNKRGEGNALEFTVPPGQTVSVDVSFIDATYLKDGTMLYSKADLGSFLRVDVVCPANSPYPATPEGTGNMDVVNGQPVHNADNTGQYRVSGTETTIHRFINNMAMLANDRARETIDTAEPNYIPPGWIVRCSVKNNGVDDTLTAAITLGMYRKNTL